ncbi:MAG TPA: type II toxin-antitoxin system VapC family toxin [Nitrososphaerales archaeon]|nr:type II toxin-antitoxin system VapC family toxin [Nitrososphaerales archaeon]
MHDRYVLDAGIIALYFAGNRRVKRYLDEILDGKAFGYICEINIAEFSYHYAREFGLDAARTKARLIRGRPIRVEGVDEGLTSIAAEFKLRHNDYSLADCYLLALAQKYDATLLTTDGPLSKNGKVRATLIPPPKKG